MSWFRVLVEGRHVKMDVASECRYVGFFVTRFVNAETPTLAGALAISAVRADPKLDGLILNDDDDPPVLSVEEIEDVPEADVLKDGPGFVIYPDENSITCAEFAPPPYLVIRRSVAFWVEDRSLSHRTATSQAFNDGCFRDACLYDTEGNLWGIVRAEFTKRPSRVHTLLPWRQLPVRIEIHPGARPALSDLQDQLAAILESGNSFSMSLRHRPADLLDRLRSLATPAELIQCARCLD